jgi:ADP-ribose pyrophosphatase YjhB (NUDIX family)
MNNTNPDYPIPPEEFKKIYSKVVRLSVEVLLYDKDKGTYLTLRDIEPCMGQWHLPGGTVLFGEELLDSVKRIGKRELDITIEQAHMVGYIEFPSHYKNGIDHPVSLVFEVDKYEGEPSIRIEAKEGRWFKSTPPNMHADQDEWLVDKGYLVP